MDSGIINSVTQEFIDSFSSALPQIESLGKNIFYSLAGIQIVITGLVFAIRDDIQKGLADFIKILFIMGICYGLILDGQNLLLPILNGFIHAGSSISGMPSISPSGVAIQGINIGFTMFDNFSGLGWLTHPFMVLITAVLFLFISLLYALITAELIIIIIKSYCLLALSGFFAAFGVNETVRQVTVNYLKGFLGCCLQLFTVYLLIGIGLKLGDRWASIIRQAAEAHELKPFLVIAISILIFYKLIQTIPPFIASFSGIQGFR